MTTLLTLCVVLATSPGAAGESIQSPTAVEVNARGDWYGWQIMLADLGAIGALSGGGALTSNSSAFAFVPISGGAIYYAGGPLIHTAHGNGDGAVRSLVRRLLIPLGGAAVGAGVGALVNAGVHHKQNNEECTSGCVIGLFAIGGFGAGMLGAMTVDWVSAREPVRPATQLSERAQPIWAPVLVVGPRGGGAGVVFHF